MTFDPASIVPSTRDFLQGIATQRKRLALVPLVENADDAMKLAETGVSAFAYGRADEAMRRVSTAIGTTPLLFLAPVATDDDALRARSLGADAVVIDLTSDPAAWDLAAKRARSTHVATLAGVLDTASLGNVAKTAAKAVYLRASGAAEVRTLLAGFSQRVRILAHVPGADATVLRALLGVVDAAIVEEGEYLAPGFEALREELDP